MKKYIEKINEIKEMKNGKAILFFGFYFVFFLVLILVIRFSEKVPIASGDDYEKGSSNYNFYLDNISSNNYHYIYTITQDGVEYKYDGNRYKNMELFSFNEKKHFRNNNDFFINNGIWVKENNPYLYEMFLDTDNIVDIISLATYESKTSYDDGRERYNFLISSNTLNQKLNNIDSDFLEDPNELVIGADKEKNVNEIDFKLDSYCVMNKICQSSLEIKLEYDKFGEIEEIENPVE